MHVIAPVSQFLNANACRPVGEISLTVEDGGSVRLEMWDTAGHEQVSFILSSHFVIASYACMVTSRLYPCKPAVSCANTKLLSWSSRGGAGV